MRLTPQPHSGHMGLRRVVLKLDVEGSSRNRLGFYSTVVRGGHGGLFILCSSSEGR